MKNTLRKHHERAIFETHDLWDIWPDQQKDNDKDNHI